MTVADSNAHIFVVYLPIKFSELPHHAESKSYTPCDGTPNNIERRHCRTFDPSLPSRGRLFEMCASWIWIIRHVSRAHIQKQMKSGDEEGIGVAFFGYGGGGAVAGVDDGGVGELQKLTA